MSHLLSKRIWAVAAISMHISLEEVWESSLFLRLSRVFRNALGWWWLLLMIIGSVFKLLFTHVYRASGDWQNILTIVFNFIDCNRFRYKSSLLLFIHKKKTTHIFSKRSHGSTSIEIFRQFEMRKLPMPKPEHLIHQQKKL